MEQHVALTDPEFERQFASGELDPALFSHEAHLRLAWIQVKQYGVEQAIRNITAQLLAFVTRHGARHKYNHTVTIAAIHAVHHFYRKGTGYSFPEFIKAFPRLKSNFRELISTHYSSNIFLSEEAKNTYLEPDLCPF